jgi:hypothetical protein
MQRTGDLDQQALDTGDAPEHFAVLQVVYLVSQIVHGSPSSHLNQLFKPWSRKSGCAADSRLINLNA